MGLWDVYNQHLKHATFTDLTHEFFPGQPKFPALPDQTVSHFLKLEDGMLFEIHQWSFVGQWGTHVDPPLHMHKGGRTVADLAVQEMLLPLVVRIIQHVYVMLYKLVLNDFLIRFDLIYLYRPYLRLEMVKLLA